jgi:hypothetical protein
VSSSAAAFTGTTGGVFGQVDARHPFGFLAQRHDGWRLRIEARGHIVVGTVQEGDHILTGDAIVTAVPIGATVHGDFRSWRGWDHRSGVPHQQGARPASERLST